jgi:hypothetical protein
MTKQNSTKLKWLEYNLPDGLVVEASWLAKRGYSTSLRSQYLAAGWLEQPVRGVYRRPGGPLAWEHVVISLQMLLERPLAVGGRTALELQGYGQNIRQQVKEAHLYGPKRPPSWLTELQLGISFVYHNSRRLFSEEPLSGEESDRHKAPEHDKAHRSAASHPGLIVQRWGHWGWPLTLSSPERAILELLEELPKNESFYQADMLMEGLSNLSPRRLQALLENCRSVKAKRLFFYFGDRHQHAWLKRLERKAIDLGTGDRQLVEGGKLNSTYRITVPEDMDSVQ